MIPASLCTEVPWERAYTYQYRDDWVMEQKLDGHRILLQVQNGVAKGFNRNGQPYSRPVPVEFPQPAPGTWVLDGELVGDTYWVFDIPVINGALNVAPLRQRRLLLEQFIAALTPTHTRLVPQAATTQAKHALLERVERENLEGVVVKQRDRSYKSAGWLKAKNYHTVDCIVIATRIDGKENASLGLIDTGRLVEMGHCSLLGPTRSSVQQGDVVEVRYLYVGANGHLYQPVLQRVREDKAFTECTIDQLIHVNKEVIA